MKLEIYRLNDEFNTVIRELVYKGHVIRIESWVNLGFRLQRKKAAIRWANGTSTSVDCANYALTFNVYAPNSEILKRARQEIQAKATA